VLDVFAGEDLDAILDRRPAPDRLLAKLLRLCRQAYEQNGLLSNCDLAAMLNVDDTQIGRLLSAHEHQTGQVVPRRATLHDVGSGLTHKRIICLKRFAEGKAPEQIARETHHSQEAVDHYLSQYDRVRCCRLEGMTPEETAYLLDCSPSLVQEYLRIDRELEGKDA
jgi:DNA-binding CsgD family transcriptional regulator